MICGRCGQEIEEGSEFCTHCGNIGAPVEVAVRRSDPRGMTALILTIVPGLFNIFGLGHLYLKRYVSAIALICTTAILFAIIFIYDVEGFRIYYNSAVFIVFFIQALDIMRINSSRRRA